MNYRGDNAHSIGTVLEEEFEYLHGTNTEGGNCAGESTDCKPTVDTSSEQREIELRKRIHALEGDDRHAALCLSGGGIRSATFSLGVLQGLARQGHLDKFHFLSTVSGGGYIGSWLTSWIRRESLVSAVNELSSPRIGREPESKPIQRLRAYSNYLSPVWGFSSDFLTLIAIFLRNLFLHWLVFIPLLAAILILPRIQLAVLGEQNISELWQWVWLVIAGLLVVTGIAYVVVNLSGPGHREARNKLPIRLQRKWWCWAPIVTAAVIVSWVMVWPESILKNIPTSWFVAGSTALHILGVIAGSYYRNKLGIGIDWNDHSKEILIDFLFVCISGVVAGWGLYEIFTSIRGSEPVTFEQREFYAVFLVPLLLSCYWLGTTTYVGLSRKITSENDREWWARSSAAWLAAALVWVLIFVLVIYGPQWIFNTRWSAMPLFSETFLGGGGLLGVITGLIGFWSKNGSVVKRQTKTIIALIGNRLLEVSAAIFILILFLSISYATSWGLVAKCTDKNTFDYCGKVIDHANLINATNKAIRQLYKKIEDARLKNETGTVAELQEEAKMLRTGEAKIYAAVLEHTGSYPLVVLLGLFISICWLTSFLIGANTFSLHSMYGNRLVRAYLGATHANRSPHWFTGFDPDDNLNMKDMKYSTEDPHRRKLLHVVNLTLNMVRPSGDRLEWQQRKATSFTISPLHSGSVVTDYVPTSKYSATDGVTLGRAMAISGAAASPNMGYHTSPAVAFVMAFFNIRLGWWLPNPKNCRVEKLSLSEPPRSILYIVAEALSGSNDKSEFVYLSDGGHFENLALYEMVRRRCGRIVVVDAGCDPKYQFEDLENAIRKIRVDLGISIKLYGEAPMPGASRMANCHMTFGTIAYSDVDGLVPDGELVYIKPVITGDEPLDVLRYATTNNNPNGSFPHQPTSDQFFDEAQFESYRMLGYHSVINGFRGHGSWFDFEEIKKRPLTSFSQNESQPNDRASPEPTQQGSVPNSLVSGITDGFKSIGQSALMVSAITVGGVLGVSGTVALRDSSVTLKNAEIAISDSSLKKLKEGIPVEIKKVSETQGDLQQRMDILVDVVKEIRSRVVEPAHIKQLEELTASISKLEAAVRSGGMVNIRGMTSTLQNIEGQLKTANESLRSGNKDLGDKLTGIKDSVDAANPRRNIRGVVEGGAR